MAMTPTSLPCASAHSRKQPEAAILNLVRGTKAWRTSRTQKIPNITVKQEPHGQSLRTYSLDVSIFLTQAVDLFLSAD